MSRISDDHLDCAVYMYPTREAAKEGLKAGGSGFLVGIPSTQRPGNLYLYVVTNRHVIQGNSLVIRMNTINGSTEIFESDYSHWREHPDGDDIAVAPLVLRENTVKFSAVPFNMF